MSGSPWPRGTYWCSLVEGSQEPWSHARWEGFWVGGRRQARGHTRGHNSSLPAQLEVDDPGTARRQSGGYKTYLHQASDTNTQPFNKEFRINCVCLIKDTDSWWRKTQVSCHLCSGFRVSHTWKCEGPRMHLTLDDMLTEAAGPRSWLWERRFPPPSPSLELSQLSCMWQSSLGALSKL